MGDKTGVAANRGWLVLAIWIIGGAIHSCMKMIIQSWITQSQKPWIISRNTSSYRDYISIQPSATLFFLREFILSVYHVYMYTDRIQVEKRGMYAAVERTYWDLSLKWETEREACHECNLKTRKKENERKSKDNWRRQHRDRRKNSNRAH